MKRIIVCFIFIIFVLSGCAKMSAGASSPSASDSINDLTTGRFYKGKDCSIIFIDNEGPVVMTDGTKEGDAFANLSDGDLISVKYDFILESYPGQTTITSLTFVKNGDLSDINQDELKNLQDLGW